MKLLITVLIVLSVFFVGCTQNASVRNYGGEATVYLPKGQKLVNITWKEQSMWYLTKPFSPGDKPESYVFREKSPLGMVEGTLTLIESNY